ncbi:MAG: acyl-CoA dehydrogenase [Thermoleophilaceae bacterium]|nr:acyl-CoA dehydrogenase [Thermoleophilaceae bacterium]
MIRESLYNDEHQQFRESFRRFLATEVVPQHERWEDEGIMPRAIFAAAGEHGFLGMEVPEEYGGAGVADFRFNAVIGEEVQTAGVRSFGSGITLHNDICLPYFLSYGTDAQRKRWLPAIVSGEAITAIAMTEPGAGSDLAAIRTKAHREGDVYRVNGTKTFITNGQNADLVITATRTAPGRHDGLTLVVIERGMDGFSRGRNLHKIGLHAQDTAELFFDDVEVPVENVLGQEGDGFRQLVSNLPQERLSIAIAAVAASRAALDWTLAYVKERQAFGQPIGSFQASRFSLAEMHTEVTLGELLVDRCVAALAPGELEPEDAAMAKYWCTDLQGRVVDRCVQLHGGYGYMTEYPIARAYADARISRIYGGANEIMKEVVGRSLGLGR